MRGWISRLHDTGSLPREGYEALLSGDSDDALREAAQRVTLREFGRGVYVRALVEISNYCRNNCYYCGIRSANRDVVRYRLSQQQIVEACEGAYALGFRTFVLQGGEDPQMSDEWVVELVEQLSSRFDGSAVTLSLGERSREVYQRFYDAGASRYLLRFESSDKLHYQQLHPLSLSCDSRFEALAALRSVGYQVGTGMMVGSPHQSLSNLVDDLIFLEEFRAEMVGIGPFIPHSATPFADFAAGDVAMTLRLISILRLMHPRALIPATTALATLAEDGRERGILAGANVVMPNVTPPSRRGDYALYDNKAAFGSESMEGLQLLAERLRAIGREINFERGDYVR
ncbi:MAG: [FeFe] hydrogenase H-cluster radical SAM maturase HydE [Rikenellaceae bacterium]